jgi:phosphoadenylyl-sulfate reductase (thioredoxin)
MLTSQLDHATRSDTDAQLESGGGHVVELPGESDWREARDAIAGAVQVDIRFPKFNDGRGFTLAAHLRERAGFKGHLRAVGALIPDQAQFLKRVGFDAVSPDRTDLAADWARAEARFSVVYQPAVRGPLAVPAKRIADGADLAALNARYSESDALDILHDAVTRTWRGRIALMSSFGAEAAVSLHLLARVDPSTPVLFLDTGRLFAQTEQYQRELTDKLGLTNIRILKPNSGEVSREDADGKLWSRDSDACCAMRKVRPLDGVIGDYDALITGRKRFHGGERMKLPAVERVNGTMRINPLARWSAEDVQAYFRRYDLPRHPLTDMGYASIGCWTCTAPAHNDDVRSGRWVGQDKSECGIHRPLPVAAE